MDDPLNHSPVTLDSTYRPKSRDYRIEQPTSSSADLSFEVTNSYDNVPPYQDNPKSTFIVSYSLFLNVVFTILFFTI